MTRRSTEPSPYPRTVRERLTAWLDALVAELFSSTPWWLCPEFA